MLLVRLPMVGSLQGLRGLLVPLLELLVPPVLPAQLPMLVPLLELLVPEPLRVLAMPELLVRLALLGLAKPVRPERLGQQEVV